MLRRSEVSSDRGARQGDGSGGALLDISILSKSFGGVLALDSFSLIIPPDQIVGIVGPNGAGKTVLINLITGFYKANSGSIQFAGRNIVALPRYKISRLGIARTFQNIRLFKRMTVFENVLVAASEEKRRLFSNNLSRQKRRDYSNAARELLSDFRLEEKANLSAGALSYGEARRLEICRALMTKPKLLLLDEPAAGMNESETEKLIADIVQTKGLVETILVIEHDTGMIRRLSDRVVAMNYGRKIAEGTATEVFENPEVVEAYLGAPRNEDV